MLIRIFKNIKQLYSPFSMPFSYPTTYKTKDPLEKALIFFSFVFKVFTFSIILTLCIISLSFSMQRKSRI